MLVNPVNVDSTTKSSLSWRRLKNWSNACYNHALTTLLSFPVIVENAKTVACLNFQSGDVKALDTKTLTLSTQTDSAPSQIGNKVL